MNVKVVGPGLASGAVFYFDRMGRPYNSGDALGSSTFNARTYTFTSGTNSYAVTVETETGYVYNP